MAKEFWGCNGCDHSKYDEFCTECGTCVNGSNYEKSCCYECDGCTYSVFNNGEWYCEKSNSLCEGMNGCDYYKDR